MKHFLLVLQSGISATRVASHSHAYMADGGTSYFGVDDDDLVTDFIDQIIKFQWPVDNPPLQKLVNRQIHRHYHASRKKSNSECCFNYPQPPMRATEIVYPLEADMPQNKIKQHKDTWKSIKKQSDDLKEGQCITVFEECFLKLKVTENDSRSAVRSSVDAPTVFLKRNPNELRINNYNPACLEAWRANMDIQFVLDMYACAMYRISFHTSLKHKKE